VRSCAVAVAPINIAIMSKLFFIAFFVKVGRKFIVIRITIPNIHNFNEQSIVYKGVARLKTAFFH
jgi:hypothetical protein